MSLFKKKPDASAASQSMQAAYDQMMQNMYYPFQSWTVSAGTNVGDPKPEQAEIPHDKAIRTEPIIAYRAWTYESGKLAGIGYPVAWPYGEPAKASHASSAYSFTGMSNQNCKGPHTCKTCGLYGFKTIPALKQVFEGANILGRVALWGKIVEHEDGYRAEFAYPQVLYTADPELEPLTRAMADLYGCDVAPLPVEIAREYLALKRVQKELLKLKGAMQNG